MLGLIRELIYKIRSRDNKEYFLDSQTKESIGSDGFAKLFWKSRG